MKIKQLLITGLAVTMLGGLSYQPIEALGKEKPAQAQQIVKYTELTDEQVQRLVKDWAQKQSYVQRGGDYKEGEYQSFQYKGSFYRYLSKNIDTKKELINYLTKTITPSYAEIYIKDLGLIEHKGRLAQPEADGGSILQWDKAIVLHERTFGANKEYKVLVPVGETKGLDVFKVQLKYVKQQGWKINTSQYSHQVNLDIPFNIHPAFIYFKYLLIDSRTSEEQLITKDIFDTEAFKKGIKKVEVRSLKEQGRLNDQVDYKAVFYVELEKTYKGPLKNGLNEMYFLIENTGEFEYIIMNIGSQPHI